MKDVLSVGVPESGGADAGMGKMAASQDSRAWPRAEAMFSWEMLGSMHVHGGQTVTGMCL